jgi:hypothetical protein
VSRGKWSRTTTFSALLIFLQIGRKRRADERTPTAYPCSSYECAVRRCRGLQRLANPAYLGGFLFSGLLRVAPYCVPGGIRVVSREVRRQWITRRRFLCNPDVPYARGPPNRRGEAPTRDFHLRLRFPGPFTRADIHAGLTHVVLLPFVGPGITGVSDPVGPGLCTILHLDFGEFLLPRTRVNKVKRKRLR